MDSLENREGSFIINSDDLDKDLNEFKGGEIYAKNNGPFIIDIWKYVRYFKEHIQIQYESEDGQIIYDGNNLDEWADKYEKEKRCFELQDFIKNDKILKLQKELIDKYNVHLNAWAFFVLATYISDIVQNRAVLLFAPTIEDTLNEIKELDSITFIGTDGTKHTTSSMTTLKIIQECLEQKITTEDYKLYNTCSLVKCSQVYTKEICQAEFVYYLSCFLHQYFDIKRRNNGFLSGTEQRLVSYCIKYFGLSTTEISDSRFRQLRNIKGIFKCNLVELPLGKDEKSIPLQLSFLKWKDWKKGKINILSDKVDDLKQNEHFIISPQTLKNALI